MKIPKGVAHWDDERECGNGIIVMLKSGFKWDIDDHGQHTRGFDTAREARAEIKHIVQCPCNLCDDGE